MSVTWLRTSRMALSTKLRLILNFHPADVVRGGDAMFLLLGRRIRTDCYVFQLQPIPAQHLQVYPLATRDNSLLNQFQLIPGFEICCFCCH